jgi:NADH-quinone oxidoreductase subunit L
MTAFYAFRMVFRVFWGEPNAEARQLEHGHIAHAEPFNPTTGEREDTDVGYPGPEHHIAEREMGMKVPMALLAVASVFAGLLQIPGVTHVIEHFLDPTFEDSRYAGIEPGTGINVLVLVGGAITSVAGIGLAWWMYVRRPGTSLALAERMPGLHRFLSRKWYFDEAYDALIVRPMQALGRGAQNTFERVVVDGIMTGTAQVVRAGNALVRSAQSGLVRNYALLLATGVTGLALYFLVVSH